MSLSLWIAAAVAVAIIGTSEIVASGPLHPFGVRVWAAADDFNASAITNVVVVDGYAIVGTRGPALIGKRVDTPVNNSVSPPPADWYVDMDGTPVALVSISDRAVAVVTNDTVGGYGADGTPLWNFTVPSSVTLVSNSNTPVCLVVDMFRGIGLTFVSRSNLRGIGPNL